MKSRSNNSSFHIEIFHEIKFLSDLTVFSIICIFFSTFSLFGQTDAMQFSYGLSSNVDTSSNFEEHEERLDFIVSKSGGLIMKTVIPGNSSFTIETYMEDINDSGSKQSMLFGMEGTLLYIKNILLECDIKSSKEELVQIEKMGKNSLRVLKSDSSELIYYFSDKNKYQDYRFFVAKGMFGNFFTIPIPDSIQTRDDNKDYTLKLIRTKERNWKEVLENFSARSADATRKVVTAEEYCDQIRMRNTITIGF